MSFITHADLDTKKRKLDSIRAALKTEFFGIDAPIDKIMDSVQTWYLMPSIISRPVITCLWGMTGCGKTALVRSLVSHLGMSDRFLEVQMDGFSGGVSSEIKSIFGLLTTQSGIPEGQHGIVLLDEFQRFRTINDKGEDIRVERYPDVWMLLSDGRFPADHSKLERLLDYIDNLEYWQDHNDQQYAEMQAAGKVTTLVTPVNRKRRFFMNRGEADEIKSMLRLNQTPKEIMGWSKEETRRLVEEFLKIGQNKPFDFTKCLVFVSGNLDEAFRMSGSVEDCDTSADVFYNYTLKIGAPEIKAALSTRFRPEQISRLGNNHIVYPSLRESAYMSLIRRTCLQFLEQTKSVCKIDFTIEDQVYQEIYDNSVYPTQGTRPVFTSIHKLFGSPLSDAVLWGLQHNFDKIAIGLDIPASSLVFRNKKQESRVKIDFEIRARRKSRSDDFNALVAVHEAGHAIVYAELFKQAPIEVAINVASFKGGYNLYQDTFLNKEEVLKRVAVSMAGIVAEEAIFGQELRSTGCEGDVGSATKTAAKYVRRWAMDGYQSMYVRSMDNLYLEDLDKTDSAVELIVAQQKEVAKTIVNQHRSLLLDLSRQLLKTQKIEAKEFAIFVGERIKELKIVEEQDVSGNYAARLDRAG